MKEITMTANVRVREIIVPASEAALNEALAENQVEPEKIISVMLQPGQHMAIGDHGPKYRVVYRP
jgi:chorismate mutase